MVNIDHYETTFLNKIREIERILIDIQLNYNEEKIIDREINIDKINCDKKKTKKNIIEDREINIDKINCDKKKTKKKIRKRRKKTIRFFSNYVIDTSSSSSGIDSN